MLEHSQECIAARKAEQEAIGNWKVSWPNHCPDCVGHGGMVSSYDPSPAGVSLGAGCYYDFEPCPNCQDSEENSRCPRCGTHWDNSSIWEKPLPCPSCGWEWDKNAGDSMPDGLDDMCPCQYAEWEREEKEAEKYMRNNPY